MVINHNVSALNTLSYLNKNTKATQSSLEKLSSGKKINKAADDASGLAISQKMQAQINGLDQASQNVSDGTSLIQTAEGSLGKEQEILQKMRTLAVQAQNGTASSDGGSDGKGDKGNVQDQVNQLAAELDEISSQTSYNTMNVIGTAGVANSLFGASGITLQIGYDAGQTLDVSLSGAAKIGNTAVTSVDAQGLGIKNEVDNTTTVTVYTSGATIEGTQTVTSINGVNTTALLGTDTGVGVAASSTLGTSNTVATSGTQTLNITASDSITTVQSAIDAVSKLRSKLGAYQNRLEYAGDNLGVESQNLTTAMSGVTDADMASEMMTYTKNNILVQSAEAMLAQANQLPQGMLSLIKS